MDILSYENCISKMEEAGINVRDYNNYIVSQTLNTIYSNIGSSMKVYTDAVDSLLSLKCLLCSELKGLNCTVEDFNCLTDASLFVMVRNLYFTLDELCELFHVSALVVSSRLCRIKNGLEGVDDGFIAAISSRVTGQILENRGRRTS